MIRLLAACLMTLSMAWPAAAQSAGPLRIEITEGIIEPLPVAVPTFLSETPGAARIARSIERLLIADLVGTQLFREVPKDAHIQSIDTFDAPVRFPDWKAVNAQALVVGSVSLSGRDQVVVRFRLYDVFSEREFGASLQFAAPADNWRRIAHKVADTVYSRITGETGYFDSRVVFVSETGPKNRRRKRLAIMDYDGANTQFLTGDNNDIVLAPRFSPDGSWLLYTSYRTGSPRAHILNIDDARPRLLDASIGNMTFSPRFAPDGRTVVFSVEQGGNTDIWRMNVDGSNKQRLTLHPAIDTAPSFSPDGSRIVFESDRSGTQQIYIMSASGNLPRRISFGPGRYGTPVWSPNGDYIAFTKQNRGRFHIGVMRIDGSEERLLTASFLDEGPTWSPNGRVLMFARGTAGVNGGFSIYSVDISGRNLKRVPTPAGASDPAWSPLRN